MLQGINRIGRSWIGRLIVTVMFAFLIASFALWGINDIFRGAVRSQVATVGGVDITAEAFRNAYQTEYQNLIRRTRRGITPEQARAFGLEQRVLARLVSEAAFDYEAKEFGLGVSDALVLRSIQADPAFKGPSGAFDPGRFLEILRENGLSEGQYVRLQRTVVARQQVAEGVNGALRVPIAMREAVHRYQSEHRTAELIRLGPAILGEIAAPSETQLQSFYDERKASFRAPEYRSLRLMKLDADALAKPEAVTDEEARAYYARVKEGRFGTPERRTLQQILFPTKVEAEAAATRIKEGATFEAVATERGVDEATLNLGTLARGEVLDPVVAEAAFGLESGAVSAPIETRFGPALIRVTAIQAGSLKPFEEVAGEIKADIARDRARPQVQALHDAIEDDRASGKALDIIAKERGLALVTVAQVDRNGRDKAAAIVETVPERDVLLAAAFRSEIGSDSEAVAIRDAGYIWYDVLGIEPARDRPLAEVKERVAEEWRKAEISSGLADKARGFAARLDAGETVEKLATELGLTHETASDIARSGTRDDLPAPVVTRIFATPVGKSASAATGDDGRVLFRVTGATAPPFVTTTQDSSATEEQLRRLVSDDLLAEYVEDVKKRIGVTYYPENIRRAIGGES